MQSVYSLSEPAVAELKQAIKKINNKSPDEAINYLGYEIVDERFIPHPSNAQFFMKEVDIEFFDYNPTLLSGGDPWLILGFIMKDGESFLAESSPLCDDPSIPQATDIVCHVCGTKRHTSGVYIMQNQNTKEIQQIGQTCLGDFADVPSHGKQFDLFYHKMVSFVEEINRIADKPRIYLPEWWNLGSFMTYVCASIRVAGYISSSMAIYGQNPTADDAYAMMTGKSKNKVNDDDISMAFVVCQLIKDIKRLPRCELDEKYPSLYLSDKFYLSLREAISGDFVSHSNYKILASVAFMYRKMQETARQRSAFKGHLKKYPVGPVNTPLLVKFLKVAMDAVDYDTARYHFEDENGVGFVWWTVGLTDESGSSIIPNSWYEIRGPLRVKAHNPQYHTISITRGSRTLRYMGEDYKEVVNKVLVDGII